MRVDRRLAAAAVAAALLAGCTPVQPPIPTPTVSPSPTPTPRDFTVSTTGPIKTADPAVAVGDTDSLIATTVYQRLMQVQPGSNELKPDAATDCFFASQLIYQCTLPKGLVFHNGDELTSSDVRFSIQRALRLDVPGTSVNLLDSLVRITTPDAATVQFHLGYADNRFGYALASQAASIVDEQTFNPDAALPADATPVGSGPYRIESMRPDEVRFARYLNYVGALSGVIDKIVLQHLPDSVAAETAIEEGTTDAVWRSLDPPAVDRIESEIAASADKTTAKGFTRYPLNGTRVTRLAWTAESRHRSEANLRNGVALALQPDRTSASLVPIGITGYQAAYPIGGRPTLPKVAKKRLTLLLRYDPSAPGHAAVASLLRTRIEELDRVSVRLVTEGSADLALTDAPSWLPIATAWLQPYLDDPLPGSAAKLTALDQRARSTTGDPRLVALGELQQQAAADVTMLPVSQSNGVLMLGRGVTLAGLPFGSSGQLGLWGLRNG